jgi:hypothetical protein
MYIWGAHHSLMPVSSFGRSLVPGPPAGTHRLAYFYFTDIAAVSGCTHPGPDPAGKTRNNNNKIHCNTK